MTEATFNLRKELLLLNKAMKFGTWHGSGGTRPLYGTELQ